MSNFGRLTYPLKKISNTNCVTLLQDTLNQIRKAQLLMVASSLAYTTLLSIIPALAVSFAIFQSFGGMREVYNLIEPIILSNLAEGTSAEVIQVLRNFIENTHARALGITGLVGLIFTSMSMLFSFEKAINQVWETKITRSFSQRFSTYWLFISLGPIAMSITIGIASSTHFPLKRLFPSGSGIFILGATLFFIVYTWVPQTYVKWQCSLISSLIAAVLWSLARFGYSFYTHNIVSYNKIYGSLGAVPILLLWIYILWVITLCGAAFTVALQKNKTFQSILR